ncbi:MAG: hypothetical protein AAGG75_16405 [Bacteroidota bacterium]
MTTIKTFLLCLPFILFSVVLNAQRSIGRTLVTTLRYEAGSEVKLDLDGTTVVSEWDNDFIRIVIEIQTNLQHQETLDRLITSKRYAITSETNEDLVMTIKNPFLRKVIMINNTPLKESLHYKIYVPRGTAWSSFWEGTKILN